MEVSTDPQWKPHLCFLSGSVTHLIQASNVAPKLDQPSNDVLVPVTGSQMQRRIIILPGSGSLG